MSVHLRLALRTLAVLGSAAAGLALAVGPAAAAPAPLVPGPTFTPAVTPHVAPNQQIGGEVNGLPTTATIRVGCFGPTTPGETGHPLPGQTLGVFVPEVIIGPQFGNTGSRGKRIFAYLITPLGVVGPVARFTQYTVAPIRSATAPLPVRLNVPCAGPGVVVFTPVPWSPGAKRVFIRVTFTSGP